MTTYTSIFPKLALSAALICFAATGAIAQDSPTSQQLPDALVNQQIPSAFPQDEAAPAANTAPQTAPAAQPGTPPGQVPAAQTSAPAATVQQTADGAKMAAESPATQAPEATNVPAQPEEKKLVPATPMGSAAQGAENAQNAAPVTTPTLSPTQPEQPAESEGAANLVEDTTATEDTPSPGLPDALSQYATPDPVTGDGAPADESGDALPQVNNLNMVRLQGDFENSNKNVAVDVNGMPAKSDKQLQEEIRTEAFDAAITGMFPLSPEQIETLLKKYDSTQKTVNTPPYDAPKPEISVQNISLDPGVAPPTIHTAVGNVTTINMLDATGAPWPVQDVTWAGDFEIVEPEEGGHIVRITPMSQFARGNIVIRMLTLKTPLTLTLETSRDVVQYRVDARIPEYGPFASAPLMQGAKSTLVAGSPDLTSLLDGVMPGGMEKLEVSGVDGRTTAYTMNGTTYVRTPLTLLSPAWQSSVSSADGMNVYALSNAPVLLLSDGGEFQRATLKEKEDLLDE